MRVHATATASESINCHAVESVLPRTILWKDGTTLVVIYYNVCIYNVCMYGWTETDYCAQNSHESPPTFPASQLAQTPTLFLPAPTIFLLRTAIHSCLPCNWASFPPLPSPACHSTRSTLSPDFLNYPNPLSIFSRSFLFALSFLVASHFITSTLFFHPFSLSRQPFVRLAFQSFSVFPHLAEERKGHWAPP